MLVIVKEMHRELQILQMDLLPQLVEILKVKVEAPNKIKM